MLVQPRAGTAGSLLHPSDTVKVDGESAPVSGGACRGHEEEEAEEEAEADEEEEEMSRGKEGP